MNNELCILSDADLDKVSGGDPNLGGYVYSDGPGGWGLYVPQPPPPPPPPSGGIAGGGMALGTAIGKMF
jgi:hypothetical protein